MDKNGSPADLPDDISVIELRSGYEVLIEDDTKTVLDHLTNAILGEANDTVQARDEPSEELFEVLGEEIVREIQYVIKSTDQAAVNALFQHLLYQETRKKFDVVMEELERERGDNEGFDRE